MFHLFISLSDLNVYHYFYTNLFLYMYDLHLDHFSYRKQGIHLPTHFQVSCVFNPFLSSSMSTVSSDIHHALTILVKTT